MMKNALFVLKTSLIFGDVDLNIRGKQVVSSLVSIYFDSPQVGTIKANCIKL